MSPLRNRLWKKRARGADARYFVPERDIEEILTDSEIREAVFNLDVELIRKNEALCFILEGAKKTFAILLLMEKEQLIVDFLRADTLQNTSFDARLPLDEKTLHEFLCVDCNHCAFFLSEDSEPEDGGDAIDYATQFYEMQWQVLAPKFHCDRSHTMLYTDVVLPFVKQKRISTKGGFGEIWKVWLHPTQQGIVESASPEGVVVVRKEIKPIKTTGTDPAFKAEEKILSTLRCLNHPSIISILTSYTYRGIHNILLPVAYSDLEDILFGRRPFPAGFQSPGVILDALYGLSSAIETVHCFLVEEFSLKFIGCHHDLKPKNILVDSQRNTFLLADFGLARIHNIGEDSKSLAEKLDGDYWAPECQNTQEGFITHEVGRKGDVWSFGCILAEVVTYLQKGTSGVQEFKECREATFFITGYCEWTAYQFHARGSVNPGVETWLSNLETSHNLSEAEVGLLKLSRSILHMDPGQRPDMTNITSRLFSLTQRQRFMTVRSNFAKLIRFSRKKHSHHSFDEFQVSFRKLEAQARRFDIWGTAIGLVDVQKENRDVLLSTVNREQFEYFNFLLKEVGNEAESLFVSWETGFLIPNYFQLQSLISKLWNLLSKETYQEMESMLEAEMTSTNDIELLHTTEKAFEDNDVASLKNIAVLSGYKHDTLDIPQNASANNPSKLLLSEASAWPVAAHPFGPHELGYMPINDSLQKQRVLIEYMGYKETLPPLTKDLLSARVGAIAQLFSKPSKVEISGLRVLRCVGYYDDSDIHKFGLVYEVPSTTSRVITLRNLIERTQNAQKRPPLGALFILARTLASSVLKIHKVGWLHKRICAQNIIFFTEETDPASLAACIESPYLIGFSRSRPNDRQTITEGLGEDLKDPFYRDYQHPEYQEKGQGYLPEYDYYSIGMILLEIGCWKTLEVLLAKTPRLESARYEEVGAEVIKTYSAELSTRMGIQYRNAVAGCLEGSYSGGDVLLTFKLFQQQVVNLLLKCSA